MRAPNGEAFRQIVLDHILERGETAEALPLRARFEALMDPRNRSAACGGNGRASLPTASRSPVHLPHARRILWSSFRRTLSLASSSFAGNGNHYSFQCLDCCRSRQHLCGR